MSCQRYLTWVHCSRVAHNNIRIPAGGEGPLIVYSYYVRILVNVIVIGNDRIEIVVAGRWFVGRRVVGTLEIVSEGIEKV